MTKTEEKKKYDIHEFKTIFHYLKHHKVRLVIYIILSILIMLPEVLRAFIWGLTLEALVAKDLTKFFIYLGISQFISINAWSILSNPRNKIYNTLQIEFTKNLSKDLYRKIDKLPARAFEEIGVGEFTNRLSHDPEQIISLLNKLINLTLRSFVAVFAVILAFKISWFLGLEIIIFAFIMGFVAAKYFPKIKEIQKSIRKESDTLVKHATENITGIREIKSLGIKENIETILFKDFDTMYKHSKEISNKEADYYAINNALYFIMQFLILFTCGYYFIQGNVAYSVFIMLETFIWRIDSVVESLSDFGVNFNKVIVSLGRINDILENRLYPDEVFGNVHLDDVKGKITFENINFKYREEEENTLHDLNLTLEPHKKIAIVGRSGNGKSTIFNLLLRYFDATRGIVKIDGVDIKDLTEESLRSNISVIRQSPFLFNMSIIDNFRLVKFDVTLEEIRDVCKKAYIDDYIMGLPDKYDTVIGEGGVNLSGGQKQRLAIARTLLLNTKIILFDEATSALDNESQEYIKKTMDKLVKDHTIIIIAHRLSTIVDADEIHVIDHGTNVASGTHQELLKSCKIYQALYQTEDSN